MDCSLPGSSVGFCRQEYWGGLPFPSPGDPLTQGLNSGSPALQASTLLPEPPGEVSGEQKMLSKPLGSQWQSRCGASSWCGAEGFRGLRAIGHFFVQVSRLLTHWLELNLLVLYQFSPNPLYLTLNIIFKPAVALSLRAENPAYPSSVYSKCQKPLFTSQIMSACLYF